MKYFKVLNILYVAMFFLLVFFVFHLSCQLIEMKKRQDDFLEKVEKFLENAYRRLSYLEEVYLRMWNDIYEEEINTIGSNRDSRIRFSEIGVK